MKTPFPELLDGIRSAFAQGIITNIKHHYNTYSDRHHLSFEVTERLSEQAIERLAVYLREECEDVIGATVSTTVVDIWHKKTLP